MTAPAYMQLYVADYLGDTRHLTCEQHGAYLLLLMTMWRAEGQLPNDPRKLARLTSCTPSRWSKICPEVLDLFVVEGEFITHSRLSLELKKASDKSIKRSEAGILGGNAKALKDKETPLAIATPLPCHSSESESETERKKEEPNGSPSVRAKAEPVGWTDFWAAYPRKVAKPEALKAYARSLSRSDPATILAGLTAHLPSWADNAPNFTPHPTTWLNRDGWADTPIDRSTSNVHRLPTAKQSDRDSRIDRMLAGAQIAVDRSDDEPRRGQDGTRQLALSVGGNGGA